MIFSYPQLLINEFVIRIGLLHSQTKHCVRLLPPPKKKFRILLKKMYLNINIRFLNIKVLDPKIHILLLFQQMFYIDIYYYYFTIFVLESKS